MTVKPFTSPEQRTHWLDLNCGNCTRPGTVPGSGCTLKTALEISNDVGDAVAVRIGWSEWLPKYFWTCRELVEGVRRDTIKLMTLQEYHAANKAAAEEGR